MAGRDGVSISAEDSAFLSRVSLRWLRQLSVPQLPHKAARSQTNSCRFVDFMTTVTREGSGLSVLDEGRVAAARKQRTLENDNAPAE